MACEVSFADVALKMSPPVSARAPVKYATEKALLTHHLENVSRKIKESNGLVN